jgi:hypothetical protein
MPKNVVIARLNPESVQTATRFNQPGETFDLAHLLPNPSLSKGSGQVWFTTISRNAYHLFEFEASGLVLAMDLNSSERQSKPVAKWVGGGILRVGRGWSHAGEAPGNTSPIESIVVIHDHLARESDITLRMETDLTPVLFSRIMERHFGGDWKAQAVAEVRARLELPDPTATRSPGPEPLGAA